MSAYAHPDGGGPAVRVTLDEVLRVAKDVEGGAGSAHDQGSRFHLPAAPGMFGHSDAGAALTDAHVTAHDIFRETVTKVVDQLRAYSDALTASATRYSHSDGDARAALLAVPTPPPLPRVAVTAHRAKSLAVPTDPTAPAGPSAEPAAPAAAPVMPPSSAPPAAASPYS